MKITLNKTLLSDLQSKEPIKIVVISLFDGLSGARVALSRVPQISVLRYYSSEVDKYAIKIANKNFPQDEPYRLGDVTKIDGHKLLKEIKKDFGEDVKIFLVGGSPCQGFSMAGKMKGSSTKCGTDVVTLEQYLDLKKDGFEFDGQSYLFWEYKRLQNEITPDWFLLENVAVTKKWLPMFNTAMEYDALYFNSNLVSAQSRPRLYWSNLEITLPKDKGIILDDVLEPLEPLEPLKDYMTKEFDGKSRLEKGIFNFYGDKKSKCITTGGGHGNKYIIKLGECEEVLDSKLSENGFYRKLLPLECERLQTLPDNYSDVVSDTRRFHAIGNGFTVEVIVEFLNSIVANRVRSFQASFAF